MIPGESVNFLVILSQRFELIFATDWKKASENVWDGKKWKHSKCFLGNCLQSVFKGYSEAMETKQGVGVKDSFKNKQMLKFQRDLLVPTAVLLTFFFLELDFLKLSVNHQNTSLNPQSPAIFSIPGTLA